MKLVVPSARRMLLGVGVLLVMRTGWQGTREMLKNWLEQWRRRRPNELPFQMLSTLLHDMQADRIARVLIAPDMLLVLAKRGVGAYRVLLPARTPPTFLVERLLQANIEVGTLRPPPSRRLFPVLVAFLPFIYLAMTYRMLRGLFHTDARGVGKDGTNTDGVLKAVGEPHAKSITFADVAGIDNARAELEELVDFLQHREKYDAIGARMPKGVLLCGPSGTGKTLLARAVATEAHVPFLFCSASDFVEMLVGRGAARVRDLFTQAAQHERCIIFIDEIDALAKARGGINSNDEREQTLNQLLTEMDGFEGSGANGVMVIAATNRPHVLDPALCRAGRFDRHVYVGLPDAQGREAILQVHTRNVRLGHDVDLRVVAASCEQFEQFSGAQLANLVNEAALLAVRQGCTSIHPRHFELAMTRAYETQCRNPAAQSFVDIESI